MDSLSLNFILIFAGAVVCLVVTNAALPLTSGYTKPLPSVFVSITQVMALMLLNMLIYEGMQLSILAPLTGAALPLAMVIIGIFFYKERASLRKIGALVLACFLIGTASYF